MPRIIGYRERVHEPFYDMFVRHLFDGVYRSSLNRDHFEAIDAKHGIAIPIDHEIWEILPC